MFQKGILTKRQWTYNVDLLNHNYRFQCRGSPRISWSAFWKETIRNAVCQDHLLMVILLIFLYNNSLFNLSIWVLVYTYGLFTLPNSYPDSDSCTLQNFTFLLFFYSTDSLSVHGSTPSRHSHPGDRPAPPIPSPACQAPGINEHGFNDIQEGIYSQPREEVDMTGVRINYKYFFKYSDDNLMETQDWNLDVHFLDRQMGNSPKAK